MNNVLYPKEFQIFKENYEKRLSVVNEALSISGNKALTSGGGGGIFNGMEARVAKLESDVGYIKDNISDIKKDVAEIKRDARTDFRLLFGAIIFVALGLAGLLAKGFHWL